MEPTGQHAMEKTVETKGEGGKRSVGFVRLWIRETLTPEVILEDI